MNKLDIKHDTVELEATLCSMAKFVPSKVHIKVGSISCKVRRTKLIQTLDGFVGARNVAGSISGSLAVCDFGSKEVLTYQKVNGVYELAMCLSLEHSNKKPVDVHFIEPTGTLQVATGSTIETFTHDGTYTNSTQMGCKDVSSIAMTSDSRILASDHVGDIIMELDKGSNKIREIKTPIKPYYMTLIHDTHMAMSDGRSGKVSVMNMESGQETLRIDIPGVRALCYDELTDCLLIASSKSTGKPGQMKINTGTIEQYNCTTGELVACIENGLFSPHGMKITPDGHLVVADKKTVKIYELL